LQLTQTLGGNYVILPCLIPIVLLILVLFILCLISRLEPSDVSQCNEMHSKPMLYISFRSSRNGRKISYRHANRYEAPPCSTSAKISACFGLFLPFRPFSPVSAGICNPTEILFWLFIYIFFLSFDLTGPFSLFLLLLPFSSFFFLLLSSAQLSLCLCTFSLLSFFCLFGSSAVIAVKY
jgi:hypothetical protein